MNPTTKQTGGKQRPRTSARLATVQTLYQMAITGAPADKVIQEFLAMRLGGEADTESFGPADRGFYRRLAEGAAADVEATDRLIAGALSEDWSLERLETLVRCILRCGAHELLVHGDTPPAVVISEYVDVAHAFFAEKEPGFVNGVLDRIARTLRADETAGLPAGEG